jgi:hypothetical protein
MKPNLSISLIKSLNSIELGGYCGWLFKAIYIDKIHETTSSDAMKLGQYLEYLLTGATLRDGSIPKAETTQKGELTANYKNVQSHKETWENIIKVNNFHDLNVSVLLEYKYKGWNLKGIADVIAIREGQAAIIDIKCTGKIDDKWSEYGWEEIHKKPNLYGQAVYYTYLYYRLFNAIPEFYFSVFSSVKSGAAKLLKIEIPYEIDEVCNKVEASLDYAISLLEYQTVLDFPSTDKFMLCQECSFVNCSKRLYSPKPEITSLFNIKF